MSSMDTEDGEIKVRPAAKAGTWYEGKADKLKKQIDAYFQAARPPSEPGTLRAVISPHAGYLYSGQTAAFGYKLVRKGKTKRVIVLAPSHYERFEGGSILDVTHYETPLGRIPLDRKACDEILRHAHFTSIPSAHRDEHSLELQLPFLQVALPEGFELIPILIGGLDSSWYEEMAKCLLPYWDESTLLVASSDFTHYGRNFGYTPFKTDIPENLEKLDRGAVQEILELNEKGFSAYVKKTGATICGRKPIAVLLTMAASREIKADLLDYTTSGKLTGDYTNSVSYASIGFFEADGGDPGASDADSDAYVLEEEEKATLLKLARHTLKTFLSTGKKPDDLTAFQITDTLKKHRGVFVTLKINGRLRGCIGYLEGVRPLYKAVIVNTINAASTDPRFPRVKPSEEKKIHMEISVLSPILPVRDLNEIKVGRDGLIIQRGSYRGTLLPQVPGEQGWNRMEFLEACCRKAGLPKDAYKDSNTTIKRYSAQVFSEQE